MYYRIREEEEGKAKDNVVTYSRKGVWCVPQHKARIVRE